MTGVPANLYPYLTLALRAAAYVAGAAILTFLCRVAFRNLRRFSDRLVEERGGPSRVELEKQTTTITTISQKLLVFSIWVLTLILVLELFGLEVRPLLAGAGVVGLVVGFAAQNVLKDLISGALLLAEGQIRINDVVKINDLSGVVEELSLRNTVLRGLDGAVHVFPNGSITAFSNLTQAFAYYVFEVNADYRDDSDRMVETLRAASEEVRGDAEYRRLILEPIEILGVDKFVEAGVAVKARIKTLAGEQWKVGRAINRRFKKLCDANGVRIATAQRTLELHDLDPGVQRTLKRLIQETLREERGKTAS